MRICGISIDSNKSNLVVLEITNDDINKFKIIDTGILKIALENETEQIKVKSFSEKLQEFIDDNKIELIGIKKRLHSGKFSGGAISFKIEATIQLLNNVKVLIIPAKTIASKSKEIQLDNSLFKYQHEAFKTAYTVLLDKFK